jgi:hypothetical protein
MLAGAAALLLSGCPAPSFAAESSPKVNEPASELPIPADLRDQIARSCAIGRQLYMLDKVAAIGTDVLFENVKDVETKGLAGYLPLQQVDDDGTPTDSYLVSFFTDETPPRIKYEIRIARDAKPIFQEFGPPKAVVPGFALLVRARQTAIAAMPKTGQPINPVLVPGGAYGEDGVLVYLLAGTNKSDVAVFGRHFRALVASDGGGVTYMKPLSNAVLEMPTRQPSGEPAAALMVTQVITDYPLETHVFTSLLVKMPVYVGTRRGVWRVNGDKISFIGDQTSKGGQ